MLIGYVRVSKSDGTQTLAPQRDAMLAAGVDPTRIYEDLASGRHDARPGLTACLKAIQPGNTLVLWKLDRLGRDLRHLVNTVEDLRTRSVGLKVLTGAGVNGGDKPVHMAAQESAKSAHLFIRGSLLCSACANRFFVPTCGLHSRRARRRSRRPEGHRVAARSVLDGREHDGTLTAAGRRGNSPDRRSSRRGRQQRGMRLFAVWARISPP